jgi:hypothetical protein
MRLVGIASVVFVLALRFVMSGFGPAATAQQLAGQSRDDRERTGQAIFRYDTFGDEQLWTDVLRMHEVIATVDPATALAVGLKVDVEALPRTIRRRSARIRRMSCGPPQDNTARHRYEDSGSMRRIFTMEVRPICGRWSITTIASSS